MRHPGFNVLENVKMIFFMIVIIVFCILSWLVLSLIAGQTTYREMGMLYAVSLPTRLIGSH